MIGKRPPRIRPQPRAAGVAVDRSWHLFTGATEQGATPTDTGSMTSAASYDDETGVFSWTANTAHVTTVDGYREAMARWSFALADIIPDFDPDQDIVELFFEITAAVASTSQIGIALGILDQPIADIASAVGIVECVYTTASWTSAPMGAIARGSAVNHAANAVDGLRIQFRPYEAGGGYFLQAASQVRYDATGLDNKATSGDDHAAVVDPADLWVHLGLFHGSTTAPGGGETWTGKLYWRRTRVGAVDPS